MAGIAQLPVPVQSTATVEVPLPHCPVVEVAPVVEVQVDGEKVADKISFRK